MATDRSALTSLLTNEQIARAGRLRLAGSRRFTSRRRGEVRARQAGRSVEFKDYKDYVEGDDIRFLDWNIFARLRKPYVRMFHDEEDVSVALVIDASASMGFEDKLQRTLQLAAMLGIMTLLGGERLVPWVLGDRPKRLQVARGRRGMGPLFRQLEAVEPGGTAALEDGLRDVLLRHQGRGITVVLSDFLTAGDMGPVFNLANGRGQEVMALQMLGPSEWEPDLDEDLRLADCETGATLDVSGGGHLIDIYRQHRDEFLLRLRGQCTGRGGQYLCVTSDESANRICFDRMRRRGWLA